MDLSFPLLDANDIKVRVNKVTADNISLLLYKDARIDQAILDSCVTPCRWRNSYQEIGKSLYCTVEIYDETLSEWIGKTNVGQETAIEREKGAASDAFKRACSNWGIGRELYTAPPITVGKEKVIITERAPGTREYICEQTFSVSKIQYEDRRICLLEIVDAVGNIVFKYESQAKDTKPAKKTVSDTTAGELLTTDEAFSTVVTVGSNTGKTLAELYKAAKSGPIIWVAENDPVAGKAALFIINRNQSLKGLYQKYKEGKA